MQEHYGIDLAEPGLLERRSGRWLTVRISGLLSMPRSEFSLGSRLQQELYPAKTDGGEAS